MSSNVLYQDQDQDQGSWTFFFGECFQEVYEQAALVGCWVCNVRFFGLWSCVDLDICTTKYCFSFSLLLPSHSFVTHTLFTSTTYTPCGALTTPTIESARRKQTNKQTVGSTQHNQIYTRPTTHANIQHSLPQAVHSRSTLLPAIFNRTSEQQTPRWQQ
jgi:hypothetical protein